MVKSFREKFIEATEMSFKFLSVSPAALLLLLEQLFEAGIENTKP